VWKGAMLGGDGLFQKKNVGFVENQKCHFLYLSSVLLVSSLFFCLPEQDSIFFLN
jgi:hypothetical protein